MDRKALIRDYKESRRPMGVFGVRNTVNGKSLVGASTDLPAMLNRQRFQLDAGIHPIRELQKEWIAFGAAAFAFEVLDTLPAPDQPDFDPSDDLRVLEDLWLDKLSPFDERGYNARPKKPSQAVFGTGPSDGRPGSRIRNSPPPTHRSGSGESRIFSD